VLKFIVQVTAPSCEQKRHLKIFATVGGFFLGFGFAELFLLPILQYQYIEIIDKINGKFELEIWFILDLI